MRKATPWLISMAVAVSAIVVALPFVLHTAADIEWEDLVDYLPVMVIGLMQVLLSIALVWYNLSRNPELKILGPDIQPEDEGRTVARENHVAGVRFRDRIVEIVRPDTTGPWWRRQSQVVCWKMPSNLRLLFDIANVGLSGITVHDYGFERQVGGRWESGLIVALFPESYAYLEAFPHEAKNITRETRAADLP
jgi:hypothetical protein